jgi:hypothetical protein
LTKQELKRLGILLILGGAITPFTILLSSWLEGNFIYDVKYVFPLLPHGIAAAIAGAIVLAMWAKKEGRSARAFKLLTVSISTPIFPGFFRFRITPNLKPQGLAIYLHL